MDKKSYKIWWHWIQENKFHQYKSLISINNIDINKIVVSNKLPFDKQGFEYFIGYKDNKEIRPLCIFFPGMSIYKTYSNKTKCMYFMIKYERSFDKYMRIREKNSYVIIKKFNSELIYNKKYLKLKISKISKISKLFL